jgi:hypothetical protein
MPKSKVPPVVSPEVPQAPKAPYHLPDNAGWGGFINVRLSDDQKSDFRKWIEENPDLYAKLLDDVLGAGMKISASYDAANQCYISTFTGRLVAESDDRYCMTTRASTFWEVLALAVWKHYFVAREDYGRFRPRTGQFDNFG